MTDNEKKMTGEVYAGIGELLERLELYKDVLIFFSRVWESDMQIAEQCAFVVSSLSKELSKTVDALSDYFAEIRRNDI